MGPEAAVSLGHALGVSPAYLMCVDDISFLESDERELLERYRQTDDRGRRTILAVASVQGEVDQAG